MRYALIGDVHGNLPALEAVLADVERRKVDAVYHLGDLVGYGPWPNEVVGRVRSAAIPGIAGNYDSYVATGYEMGDADGSSLANYAWTTAHCSVETRAFLSALPFRLDVRPNGGHLPGPTLTLVHATPTLNTVAWWSDRPDAFHQEMADLAGARRGDVIACGHIHRPWAREIGGVHFASIGSVGRPKDGDWRACYVVLTMEGGRVEPEFVRVDYDLQVAMRGIRESGLPPEYADFLRTGGAPEGAATK